MDDKDFEMASSSNSVFVNGQIENRINEEIEWGISFRKNRNQEKQLVLATTESLEFPSSTSRKPMKKKIKRKRHIRTPASPAVSERILFNRNTCTQKQYYDMLSQPRPKFHETEEKPLKSSGKSCSPRFEQLALPLKQRVLNTWQDYDDVLAPENKLWLKSLLTREECLAPKAAEKYFSKLDAKKRKDKKKKLKKQREQHVKKPQKSKIVKEIEALAKDIVNFFAEKMPVNVKYRHMMITELIKDKLVANNLVKPYKRNKRSVAGQTLYDVLDQLSVWLETNIACLTDEDLEQEAASSEISTTISSYSSSEADILLSISEKIETISVITIRSALEVVQETASIITQIHDLTDEKEEIQPDDNKDEIVLEEKTDEAEGEVVKDEVNDVRPETDQGIVHEEEEVKVIEEEKDKEGSEPAEIVDLEATETKDPEAAEIVDLDATETKDPEAAEIIDLDATETKEPEAAEIVDLDATETKEPEAAEIVDLDATETKEPEAAEIVDLDATETKEPGAAEIVDLDATETKDLETADIVDLDTTETKDLEAAEIVDLEDTKTKDLEESETVDVDATETKDLEVKKSERLEPEKDKDAHMIVDGILGDYIDSIDMEKEIMHKEIVPVEMKRPVEEHSADATCCVAMKKWAIWLAEVARNTHSWCQWIQQVIAQIRFFAAILKGDVKTADGKRRILYKEEWNSFKETLANDMTAWIEYNTHVKDLSEKIIVSFQNKRVVCCPACLDEKLIVSEETAHEVGDQLAEAIQKTGYWRTWLEQVVLQARKLTSLEIELPTAPENYSSALTSYTSFDLIEIKPAQSPSVESSDTSVYIIEEFQ